MDANIALAHLAAGRACHIGAEYRCGVHEDSPLLALLGSMPRRSIAGPHFVTSEPYHGLVQSYHPTPPPPKRKKNISYQATKNPAAAG
jgi:hypothetical protein